MRQWGVLAVLVALLGLATGTGVKAASSEGAARWAACPCGPQGIPAGEPATGPRPAGYTGLPNPAFGHYVARTADDPLGGFMRRPLDRFIVPAGGTFLDPLHLDPHYGVDYTYPDDYLDGKILWVHPIGPGYVTARSACLLCYVDGDAQGRTRIRLPRYNFGFGSLILVETPYAPDVSIYTLYAHLARDFVGLGDYVAPDEIMGVAGTTGFSENVHVHVEVRYGPPGRFWNADFSQWSTLDRWMAMMFVDPVWLVYPENHGLMIMALNKYIAEQPRPAALP